MPERTRARFIEPMLLLRTDALPADASRWEYQLKFDGYRAIAFKSHGTLHLRSRNDNDFSGRYPSVMRGLAKLPDETVVDGEVIALDEHGKPSFNVLQNQASSSTPVLYFLFDVMILGGKDVRREPLEARRDLLDRRVLPKLGEPVRYAGPLDASLPDLIASVKAQGLEGLVAKRRDSRYEPGLRSGAWQKMRVNRGQEFVIGGYTVGSNGFDALIFGYYDDDRLLYAARTRNGFTPATRAQLMKKFKGVPQMVLARPLQKLDLCDQRRLQPAAVLHLRRTGDRGLPVRKPAGTEERAVGRGPDGHRPPAQLDLADVRQETPVTAA